MATMFTGSVEGLQTVRVLFSGKTASAPSVLTTLALRSKRSAWLSFWLCTRSCDQRYSSSDATSTPRKAIDRAMPALMEYVLLFTPSALHFHQVRLLKDAHRASE